MSVPILAAAAEAELGAAILAGLRNDVSLEEAFGSPARIFDDESRRAAFPFVRLERLTSEPADSSRKRGLAHTLTLSVSSRHGGQFEARRLLGLLRASCDGLELNLAHQKVILSQTLFSDVTRSKDLSHFRGVIRVRILTEALAP